MITSETALTRRAYTQDEIYKKLNKIDTIKNVIELEVAHENNRFNSQEAEGIYLL